ncbi:MAG: M23 family metallopeptidase [Gemmatimonadetes bacterium]|nr:M23 family metallopeptidase [Gemmatimonadota bacterium]
MNLVLTLALTAICLGGETFFHAPRAYLGEQAFSLRLSDGRVANGHTLLLECIPEGPGVEAGRVADLPVARADLAGPAGRVADLTVSTGTRIHRLYPHPTEVDSVLFTLIGIPYGTAPGPDTLHVEWTESDRIFDRELPFSVVAGPYRSEQIRGVPQNRVTPSAEDFRRIARERKIIAAAYEAVRDTAMMVDTFSYPVEKKTITSPYGTRRVFNGQLRSFHGGLDLRAYEGTPLYAAQSGVVKLAQNLFYSGNHVLIEHGMGIHTGYSHMSRLYVKTGDVVTRGQLLGLSGSTGRVTAAHLHWTVNVNGVGVSPLQFTEILSMLYGKPVEVRNRNDG